MRKVETINKHFRPVLPLLVFIFLISGITRADSIPTVPTWTRIYSGFGWYNAAVGGNQLQQTSDGGTILAGNYWNSAGADDILLIKINAQGNIEWQKIYGGTGYDYLSSVRETQDGGYIFIGNTSSFSAAGDVWIVKLDLQGNIEWQRTYGYGGYGECAHSIENVLGGGYIATSGCTVSGNGRIFKLSTIGNIEWQTSYSTGIQSAIQIKDGGFIATKISGLLIKFDANGSPLWKRSLSGSSINALRPTVDGGFVLVGSTNKSNDPHSGDAWVSKFDSDGTMEWQKAYSGDKFDFAESIQQTWDGGYIVSGYSESFSAEWNWDVWLIKINALGNIEWQKTYDVSGTQIFSAVQAVSDGGYILASNTGV